MSDIGRLIDGLHKLAERWEAEAASSRGPLTADLELEGAQVRRVLAGQLREELADFDD